MPGPADYLSASDGLGEAVRAIITTARGIGNMDLITDSVANWPVKFVATSGSLDPASGLLDEATITVFKGVLTGSIITIEEFAPGYPDIGHEVNQIVVLKPSTFWADLLVQAVLDGGSVTIGPTPPTTPDPGDLWGDTNGTEVSEMAKSIGNLLYPIGSYYINETNSTNPGTLFGFGTWSAVADKTIVGKGSGTFATAGATGGAETHTLTAGEMPVHLHRISMAASGAGVPEFASADGTSSLRNWSTPSGTNTARQSGYSENAGSGGAHNNMPPYIVAYIWKRTA